MPACARLSAESPPCEGGADAGDAISVGFMGRIRRLLFGDQRDPHSVLVEKFRTADDSTDQLAAAKSWARDVIVDAGVQLDATQFSRLRAIRAMKNSGLEVRPAVYLVETLGTDTVASP